jgi:hypothetical protein
MKAAFPAVAFAKADDFHSRAADWAKQGINLEDFTH